MAKSESEPCRCPVHALALTPYQLRFAGLLLASAYIAGHQDATGSDEVPQPPRERSEQVLHTAILKHYVDEHPPESAEVRQHAAEVNHG